VVWGAAIAILAGGFAATQYVSNGYYFYAAYVVLQYVVLATAWNILGGYAGYVNFGAAGFSPPVPMPRRCSTRHLHAASGHDPGRRAGGRAHRARDRLSHHAIEGRVLCHRDAGFVDRAGDLDQELDYVGGSRGIYVLHPRGNPVFGDYGRLLFFVMLILAIVAVVAARLVERSHFGRGLAALRTTNRRRKAPASRPCA